VDQPRYAIYFVPAADSGLYRFGSAILGYDCYTGTEVARPDGLADNPWDRLTEEPRRYGFHATLKAPFHLNSSVTEAQLVSALESFAALGHAVPVITPTIQMLSGFAAVVPARRQGAVDALAERCVVLFDAFRAPMLPQERARRLASDLSTSQIQNLDRWGYPFLFSDFRLHMTLTGRIDAGRRRRVLAVLRRSFSRICGDRNFAIDALALMKQDPAGAAFRVLSRVPLRAV
jgi:hypothetical protein